MPAQQCCRSKAPIVEVSGGDIYIEYYTENNGSCRRAISIYRASTQSWSRFSVCAHAGHELDFQELLFHTGDTLLTFIQNQIRHAEEIQNQIRHAEEIERRIQDAENDTSPEK